MRENEVQVRIHGRDYKISSIKDAGYTRKLAKYCDEVMANVEHAGGPTDFLNLSVLSMLQMAHNYFEMEEKAEDGGELWDPEFEKLIDSIKEVEKESKKLKTKTSKSK
jgi:cell division protein ZapA